MRPQARRAVKTAVFPRRVGIRVDKLGTACADPSGLLGSRALSGFVLDAHNERSDVARAPHGIGWRQRGAPMLLQPELGGGGSFLQLGATDVTPHGGDVLMPG